MSDVPNSPDRVTIVKEGGSSGSMLLGIFLVVIFALIAFMVISSGKLDTRDARVGAAADKVGAAADKVGDAAQDAAKKIQ